MKIKLSKPKGKTKKMAKGEWRYQVILILTLIVMMYPIVYMIGTSFKTLQDIFSSGLNVFTSNPTMANYIQVFKSNDILILLKNSLIIALIVTVSKIVTSVLASYCLCFMDLKHPEVIFGLFTISMFIPLSVIMIPNYLTLSRIGLNNTLIGVALQAPKSVALKEIDNAEPLKITAKKNGKPLTKEQWENATVELGTVNEQGDTFALDWDIQKGSEVSTWIAIPKYKDGKMFETDTGKAEVTVDVSTEIDGNSYGKAQTVSMKIKDDRGVLDYLKHYWKQIALGLLLLILILGYIPPFKKRFPRKMKSRPSIECTAEKIGIRDSIVKGNFEKNKLSVFLPYKAEVGRLTFSPAPVKKTARVKAAGGGSMMILNTSTFAGKEDTTFNGMSIPDNYKGHYRISASTIIVVATPEFTYTCIPNVQRTADGSIKKGKRK